MIKFILSTTLLFSAFLHTQEFNLSICTIFHNDAKYLPEWIEFHQKQGVEHFYLYNNLSEDDYRNILKPYKKFITLIDWPYDYMVETEWTKIQCGSYMHCVKKYGRKSRWMAFLDTDEFLFCTDFKKLPQYLKENIQYNSIHAHWLMYGTSNMTVPEGEKITDYLVFRVKDSHHTANTMKPIAKPKFISDIVNPHFVILSQGITKECDLKELRINHYWSRDLDFFYNVKLPRRERWYHDRQIHIDMEKEYNEVYDPILSGKRD
jgi:hypothetical protein